MTIKIPEPDIFDRFLKLLGKKRYVKIPTEAYEKYGAYVIAKAKKENFWRALLRSPDHDPPKGYVDIFCFDIVRKEIDIS